MPDETITIMADFGNGPYAWKKRTCEGCAAVGPNIADATCGLSFLIGTSPGLDDEFSEWVKRFEDGCFRPDFDWAAFHDLGVKLAGRLKHEVGKRFVVAYRPPWEDPQRGTMAAIVIPSE